MRAMLKVLPPTLAIQSRPGPHMWRPNPLGHYRLTRRAFPLPLPPPHAQGSMAMKCRVAEKFVDATKCIQSRGWTVDCEVAEAHVVWDNAFNINFDAVPPKALVNHLLRSSELGHKVWLAVVPGG